MKIYVLIAGFAIIAIVIFITFYGKSGITGAVSSQVFVTGLTSPLNCNISLIKGWNLISIPCSTSNVSIGPMLLSIDSDYESVHSFDASDVQDSWKSYNPALPSWVIQDLQNISNLKGYWIRMNRSTSYNISGTFTVPTSISLITGWNLVGYPISNSALPNESFSSILSSIESVHLYNASDTSDYWKSFSPNINPAFNDLLLMVPFYGYWINASGDATWTLQT